MYKNAIFVHTIYNKMKHELSQNLKEDPSDIRQSFSDLNIRLHCCRYWSLSEWDCTNMAIPFWRLYHNSISGASIKYKNTRIELTADKIVIIPPETPFSTCLASGKNNPEIERIAGSKMNYLSEIDELKKKNMVDHLFIHFNLRQNHDSIQPGIYEFPVTDFTSNLLHEIKLNSINAQMNYDFHLCLPIHILIFYYLSKIDDEKWQIRIIDRRVVRTSQFIEDNISGKISNKSLSEVSNMATNSFARLFKENTGMSVQQFIRKKRIEKSLILLHHSNKSIEEIAEECGFIDRHHFSKVFRVVMKIPPVSYKRRHIFLNIPF
jgi:AraC-like DNA-binding protein